MDKQTYTGLYKEKFVGRFLWKWRCVKALHRKYVQEYSTPRLQSTVSDLE